MKKIWLLLSFVACCTFLTWCFERNDLVNQTTEHKVLEKTSLDEKMSQQTYTDSFKSNLSPLAVYSWYCASWEIKKWWSAFFSKRNPWLLSVYSWKNKEYLYEITYSLSDNPVQEGDSSLPPITLTFLSDTLIHTGDIAEIHWAGALEIKKSDFLRILDTSIAIWGTHYSSGVIDIRCVSNNRERCANRKEKDWQCAEFPSGTWELILPGMPDYGLPTISYHYVNHLPWKVYWSPWSYTYPDDYKLAKEHCFIEIWKASDFPELPFHLWKGFENAILARTKERKAWTSCRDMTDWISHDYSMKLINDQLICDLGINKEVKLVEVSMPESWIE